METTYEGAERARGNGGEVRRQAGKVSSEIQNLLSDVEELVKKVANVGDAEVARVRARVEKTLEAAKMAAEQGASTVRTYARDASTATDTYVHDSPWTAVGLAAAVGVLIGFFAARR
jgi:ElaB/YqjD/DUF883 family membrane-anchored ribosome-binding protein